MNQSVPTPQATTDATVATEHANAHLLQLECWAPPELRRERLTARHNGISDADPMIDGTVPWWPLVAVGVVGLAIFGALAAALVRGRRRRPPG